MKSSEGADIIRKGWVIKPKGFRLRYEKRVDDQWVTEFSPGLDENPMVSEVMAWRYAWKLSQVPRADGPKTGEDAFVNICVVDDKGNPTKYYVTREKTIFNPKL